MLQAEIRILKSKQFNSQKQKVNVLLTAQGSEDDEVINMDQIMNDIDSTNETADYLAKKSASGSPLES